MALNTSKIIETRVAQDHVETGDQMKHHVIAVVDSWPVFVSVGKKVELLREGEEVWVPLSLLSYWERTLVVNTMRDRLSKETDGDDYTIHVLLIEGFPLLAGMFAVRGKFAFRQKRQPVKTPTEQDAAADKYLLDTIHTAMRFTPPCDWGKLEVLKVVEGFDDARLVKVMRRLIAGAMAVLPGPMTSATKYRTNLHPKDETGTVP